MKSRINIVILAVGIAAMFLVQSCRSSEGKGEAQKGASKSAVKSGQPKIVAKESTFKFGKVKQGTEVEHVFKIMNKGDADLLIEKARGS